jgi:hypothetical protein
LESLHFTPFLRVVLLSYTKASRTSLDQVDTVLNFARSMTWNGNHPVVKLVTQTYQTGIKLTKLAMAEVETQIQRLPEFKVADKPINLGKWFVDIFYHPEPVLA